MMARLNMDKIEMGLGGVRPSMVAVFGWPDKTVFLLALVGRDRRDFLRQCRGDAGKSPRGAG